MTTDSLEELMALCLNDQVTTGPCGPEDPWDRVLDWTNSTPEQAWQFLTTFAARARTSAQFERLAAGPVPFFWTDHRDAYLPRLREVAAELPQLVNLVVASERRAAHAFHVMTLIDALAAPARDKSMATSAFEHAAPPELAELLQPGRHPMTEFLRVPTWRAFDLRRAERKRVTEEELSEIVEGYIRSPHSPEDDDEEDWWWALDQLITDSPEQAWTALLRIIARERDGVDLGTVGAGPLETLLSHRADELLDEIEAELPHNPAFVRALNTCYLFSLSEEALSRLEQKLIALLT